MAKKVKDPNEFEPIVVNACLMEPNTVYEVVAKEPNLNAPPIYQELGSTKERMPGVSNSISLTQSDSGFFLNSTIFNKTDFKSDWVKREQMAKKYYEIFAEPLRMYISEIERIQIPTDDEFFDKNYKNGQFSVNIGESIQFNTANPIERFKLYIAIAEGELCMKGKRTEEEKEMGLKDEQDMFHQDAQYAYISITERKSKQEKQSEIEMEASYQFGDLLRKDKDSLLSILSYINIPVKKDTPKSELNTFFKTKIEPFKLKLKEFVEMIEKYNSNPEELKLEFDIIDKIKSKKGKEILLKQGSSYYYNDTVLGSNVKSIASTFMKPENKELLTNFLENF